MAIDLDLSSIVFKIECSVQPVLHRHGCIITGFKAESTSGLGELVSMGRTITHIDQTIFRDALSPLNINKSTLMFATPSLTKY